LLNLLGFIFDLALLWRLFSQFIWLRGQLGAFFFDLFFSRNQLADFLLQLLQTRQRIFRRLGFRLCFGQLLGERTPRLLQIPDRFLLFGRCGFPFLRVILARRQHRPCLLHFINRVFQVVSRGRREAFDVFADQVGGIHDVGLIAFDFRAFVLLQLFGLVHHLVLLLDRLIQILERLAQRFEPVFGLREHSRHFAQDIARFLFVADGT